LEVGAMIASVCNIHMMTLLVRKIFFKFIGTSQKWGSRS